MTNGGDNHQTELCWPGPQAGDAHHPRTIPELVSSSGGHTKVLEVYGSHELSNLHIHLNVSHLPCKSTGSVQCDRPERERSHSTAIESAVVYGLWIPAELDLNYGRE
jgi:hypothetical protein